MFCSLRWPFFFIERRRLLQVLYEHIRDKSKVHDHTAVVSYEEADDGVVVTTNDGCSFRGDVLVGADGIHSRVRAVMLERISRIHHAAGTEIDQGETSSSSVIIHDYIVTLINLPSIHNIIPGPVRHLAPRS